MYKLCRVNAMYKLRSNTKKELVGYPSVLAITLYQHVFALKQSRVNIGPEYFLDWIWKSFSEYRNQDNATLYDTILYLD